MSNCYLFCTPNPDYIRHASPELEKLSKFHPVLGTQQKADVEQQALVHLLENQKNGHEHCEALAQKLKGCRNEAPCKSLACPHCRRERALSLLSAWQPLLAASVGYVGVTLCFNLEKQSRLPWKHADKANDDIRIFKQRISRVLKRRGCAGPAIGTFSLVRHLLEEHEEEFIWIPQLCLLLPNDSSLIKELQYHMSRGGGAYIDSFIINAPFAKLRCKDPAKVLSYALDPMWHSVKSSLTDGNELHKSSIDTLKGKTLTKSLLTLDTLGTNALSFIYGDQPK
ncbi:hypothetical protein H0I63_10075 [Yersinia enterocolitica]|nr:hypothetical protein [Yersinia enterocolitica]